MLLGGRESPSGVWGVGCPPEPVWSGWREGPACVFGESVDGVPLGCAPQASGCCPPPPPLLPKIEADTNSGSLPGEAGATSKIFRTYT